MAFVTINPNIACLTSRVFEQFDKMPISTPIMGDLNQDEVMGFKAHELISALGNTRNDLEDAAISIVPEIGGIRDLMRAQSCVKIARLTGSGATYFGLTDTLDDAKNVANILIERWPKAWVKAGYLG
jgi:4-diphosphocytidyl-2-C-methyl-D-erythritol kinase